MEVEGREIESSAVPESVMEPVKRTLANLEELRTHFAEFMSVMANPESLNEMPPLQRAESLLLLARATTILVAVKMKCNGVNPYHHPLKSEFERMNLYQEKLDKLKALSKAPVRPSTTLNTQAATRFIEHSLPDLTPEQRRSMRDISKREGKTIKYVETNVQKKRKFQSTEKRSVQTAAKEFLEKAAQELIDDNKGSLKGPLCIDISSSEEEKEEV